MEFPRPAVRRSSSLIAGLSALVIGASAPPARAQGCAGPDPLVEANHPVAYPVIHRLDYHFGTAGLQPIDLVLGLNYSSFVSFVSPAFAPIDLENAIGTVSLPATVVPPKQYQNSPFGAIYAAGDEVSRMDMSPGGTFTGHSWFFSTARAGCTGDAVGAPPLVLRLAAATDAFQAFWGSDAVLVGSALSGTGAAGCSTGSKTDNGIAALDVDTGAWLGAFNPLPDPPYSMDAVTGMAVDPIQDLLLVNSEARHVTNDSVWGIDLLSLDLIWSFDAGRVWTVPALRGGRLYVAATGSLLAVDAASGVVLWTLPLATPAVADPLAPRVPPYHDAIVFQDAFGTVHLARDLGSAVSLEWSTPLPISGVITRNVIAIDPVSGRVFAGTNQGVVHQLDATNGAVERTLDLGGPGQALSMVLERSFTDGEPVRLLVGRGSDIARYCIPDGDVVRNSLDGSPEYLVAVPSGAASFLDTDSGEVEVVVQSLSGSDRPILLTHFEAEATGPGPCDLGRGSTPCFEGMEFDLIGWPLDGNIVDPADPAAPGKLFHADVTSHLTIVRGYDVSRFEGGGLVETTLLSFDVDGMQLRIPPGGCRLALLGKGSASGLGRLVLRTLEHPVYEDLHLRPAQPPPDDAIDVPQAAVRIRGVKKTPGHLLPRGTIVGSRSMQAP